MNVDNMSKAVVAANAANNYREQKGILNFIQKYPSEEGKLAVKAYHRAIVITLFIILFVMVPLLVGAILYFDREPTMPEGATYKKTAVPSWIEEDRFSLIINDETVKYKISDYTSEKFDKDEVFNVYLNDDNEVVAVKSQDDPFEVFLLLGMFVIPIVLFVAHGIIGGRTYCKWWRLYVNWYKYEIEPLESESNFHELVKDKKYYNVLINKSVFQDDDRKLYNKYNGLAIAGAIGLVLCTAIDIWVCIQYDLEIKSAINFIIIAVYVVISGIWIRHFDKKALRIKEKYIKKETGYDGQYTDNRK